MRVYLQGTAITFLTQHVYPFNYGICIFQIGSTEWVEQNLGILGPNAVAYLNVDCAVQGSGFFAGATPQLDKLLIEITNQVKINPTV